MGNRSSLRLLAVLVAVIALCIVTVVGARQHVAPPRVDDPTGNAAVSAGGELHPAGVALVSREALHPIPDAIRAAPVRDRIERLADLRRTRLEREKLWDAVQAGIAACMAQRGFEYGRVPFDDSSDTEFERTRLQPGDVDAALAFGFGLARDIEGTARQLREEADRGGPYLTPGPPDSPGYQEALLGRAPPGGQPTPESGWDSVEIAGGARVSWSRDSCLAHAREGVYGKDHAALELGVTMSALESELEAEIAKDEAYRTGVDRWRSCMAGEDFPYAAPGEAMTALADAFRAGRLTMDQLRAAEIEAAVAEATCYRTAGLGDLTAAARRHAEQRVLAQSQDKAHDLRRSLELAVARADAVLAAESHGSGAL